MTDGSSLERAKVEALRYLRSVLDPGDIGELRILGATCRPEFPPFTVAGYFDSDHLEDLTAVVLQWTRSAEGVYVTINPPVPALLARCANRVRKQPKVTTGDAEINRRTGLV